MTSAVRGARHATFEGDVTAEAVGQVVGPNTLGEWLIAVDAVYNSATDRTTVGYRYATAPEVEESLGQRVWAS